MICLKFYMFILDCIESFFFSLQRFGSALVPTGQLNLKSKIFATDFQPIDQNCSCSTCKNYTRAYLHTVVNTETVAGHLITIHNVAYQVIFLKCSQNYGICLCYVLLF